MASSGSKPAPLFAPLLLRVVVGATFIWAGLGKLVPSIDYKGQDAAILANLGTGITPTVPTKVQPTAGDAPAMPPPASLPLPPSDPQNKPANQSKPKTSRQTRPINDVTAATTVSPTLAAFAVDELPAAADTARKVKAATNKPRQPAGSAGSQPQTTPPAAPYVTQATKTGETLPPGGKYTAADFPEPVKARRAYTLCLVMVKAAYPQPAPAGGLSKPYWPKMLADSPWVVWLAFAVAVSELFAGVLLLVGFLTRLSALMVVAIMMAAMWLSQIGPAYSLGQTILMVIPDKTWWDPALWTPYLWQLLIMASCVALASLGAGAVSVDRALAIIGSGGPKAEQDPAPKA